MHVLRGSKQRKVGLSLLVVGGIALMVLCLREAPVPRVILLPANTSIAPSGPVLDRWVPMSWAWYWRAKDFVLGRPKAVVIEAVFVSGERMLLPTPEQLAFLPPAVKSVTNLQIYFVHTNESASMYKLFAGGGSYSASSRISTGHGIHAKVMSGSGRPSSPSFSLEVLAKRRGDYTDLMTSIEATGFGDSITTAITNLAIAARFQIPKEHAVFILKSGEGAEGPEKFGVILTAKWK